METFLTILAWSNLPQVSEELWFFLSRVEALVLVDTPHPLAGNRHILESLLYYVTSFLKGKGRIEDVFRDLKLLSTLSSSCSSAGFPPETGETGTECASITSAASRCLELYHQHLDGRHAPRLHVSPLGDAYYLKRFISPPDMPSFYLPHSRRTLEGSSEQLNVRRFLADCLAPAFASQRLRYSIKSRRVAVAKALGAALHNMKALLAGDALKLEGPMN